MPTLSNRSGFWLLGRGVRLKLPVPIMPTLPEPNCRGKVSPFSALVGRIDQAFLVHHAGPFEHLGDVVADQRLVAGIERLDLAARGPDQRAEGEDVAAGAVAREVVAVSCRRRAR